jgi:hypothetical protein
VRKVTAISGMMADTSIVTVLLLFMGSIASEAERADHATDPGWPLNANWGSPRTAVFRLGGGPRERVATRN